ncbi:MAG TPA: HEAT repeat domain-containing protein, partial [Longimicrobiales bacterium]|nr:HEAT repeat domain-containing protein [Longimicrobiales bacterium]
TGLILGGASSARAQVGRAPEALGTGASLARLRALSAEMRVRQALEAWRVRAELAEVQMGRSMEAMRAPLVVADLQARQSMEAARYPLQAEVMRVRQSLEAVRRPVGLARMVEVQAAMAAGLDASRRVELAAVEAQLGALGAAAAGLSPMPGVAVGRRSSGAEAPEPWLRQDPADSLYRAAREALNRRDYRRSAQLFREIRERYPDSGYVGDSYYLQALALQQAGGTAELEEALGLLETMLRERPGAATRADARALRVRIRGSLARRGDVEAAMEVTEQAAQSCDEEDQGVRAAALSALLQMDAARATPILEEVLRDRDACSSELRKQAVFILGRKSPPDPGMADIFLDLAYRNPDPDPEVREAAVFWLSQAPTDEALDALESILEAPDADAKLQETALFAVARQDSPRSGEILRSYAERADAPRGLREAAILQIGRNERFGGGDYLRRLYGRIQDPELRENVFYGIAQSGGEANGSWLLERARDPDEDPELRRMALYWAGQAGAVGTEDLEAMYESATDREMKEQVIFVLAREDDPGAVDALMDIAASEEDRELRQQAVFWLGRSDDPRVPDFLLRLIRGGG